MKLMLEEKFYDEFGKLFNVIKCRSCTCCPYWNCCSPMKGFHLTVRKYEIRYKRK